MIVENENNESNVYKACDGSSNNVVAPNTTCVLSMRRMLPLSYSLAHDTHTTVWASPVPSSHALLS
jgi:hypothetical protein